jgi:glycosyltransferase involved in cell wall biosynthesis/SAM-dependent methyltransferase
MRVAFFSPMPPARSGIADYSDALAGEMKKLIRLEIFSEAPREFDASGFDIAVYQLGNNPYHGFVYETALAHPGVVVLHEANLHHLVKHLTVDRGDWDAYERECEYDGGAAALEHARQARALVAGPDYTGVPMLRRVLENARGVIVHSQYMVDEVRRAGFEGPLVRIPHGAWLAEADRWLWRDRLGAGPKDSLIGLFGFLKPYKRIPEALRAFRRLVRLEPRAKMILAGEPHPDLPLGPLINSLELAGHVRVLGFVPAGDLAGYIAACDAVINLRYPTVGESSGTLQRALGLGRPALVSDIGAFRDYPDGVCLKVPVGAGEEDTIFEYLSLLISRPDVAAEIGARARAYAERECAWSVVARRYCEFLEAVVEGREAAASVRPPLAAAAAAAASADGPPPAPAPETVPSSAPSAPEPARVQVAAEDITKWTPPGGPAREYLDEHLRRLLRTLEITPPGGPMDRILEMGSYLQMTPALKKRLGYGEVRLCYYGPAGRVVHRKAMSIDGEEFECDLELFDADVDPFPYPDGYFATVLCCEIVEHLSTDPMHMMSEINRVLRPGGHVVMTTPNINSLRALLAMLNGYHPGFYQCYIAPHRRGSVEPRHSREYAPCEVKRLLEDSGFEVTLLETGPFRDAPRPELAWVQRLLREYGISDEYRGDDIFAVGRKSGPVQKRWPEWLYES